MSAPIRFLLLLIGGWIGLRAIVLGSAYVDLVPALPPYAVVAIAKAPPRREQPAPNSRPLPAHASYAAAQDQAQHYLSGVTSPRSPGAMRPTPPVIANRESLARRTGSLVIRPGARPPPQSDLAQISSPGLAPILSNATPLSTARTSPPRRWSGSAWLFARRDEEAAALAPGGTLGGSQAGARLLYRLNGDPARPLSISARLYAPRRTAGAEAAIGLDWRPFAVLPLHILAERRQRLGREGRSALSIAAYGGGSVALGRGLRLDAYGQAGIVGLRSRDAFIDGAVRVAAPIGPIEAGGGLWAGAQPGVERVDVGPHLALPIRAGDVGLRLSADYRFRLAGDARPGSGPALTIGADF